MSRFYVPKENVGKRSINIEGDEAHHILDVMRLCDGDKVVVFDGTGNEYSGFLKQADLKKKKVVVEIVRTERPALEKMPEIVLAQSIPKKSKMDAIVEKATELGVSRVIPLLTDRTIVRPDAAGSLKKTERWRRISREAAKQCGRTDVPKVDKITRYADMISVLDDYDLVLMACLVDDTVSIKDAVSGIKSGNILVLIGPEGDFTPEEIEMGRKGNCRFVTLGKRILKSDTAGLFMLSVLNYEFAL